MSSRIILCIVIMLILLVNLPETIVAGDQPIKNLTLDSNQIPIVTSPLEIIYVEGDTANNITWEISDDDPSYWIVFRDGVHIDDSSWENNNETVIVDIDGFSVGNYEYMILVSDNLNNVTDNVSVKVLSTDIEIHAPFSLYSDFDFNDIAQSEGWMGNGSLANPYIIEKLFIEAAYDCIRIHGTTVHFIIRNCTFVGSGINNAGTTGHEIIWYLNWTHPSMYSIFKDDVLIEQQTMADGVSIITHNVDGLPIGVFNFTLEITDDFNYTASDTVIVHVNPVTMITSDTTTTPINSTTPTNSTGFGVIQEITLIISISSTIIIVVMIVLILRTKRGTI